MKLYVYAYYNNLGGFYGKPFVDDHKPEDLKDGFYQSIFGAPVESLNGLKEDDLYYLGCFDNITGEYVACKEFMLHCSEVVEEILKKRSKESEAV